MLPLHQPALLHTKKKNKLDSLITEAPSSKNGEERVCRKHGATSSITAQIVTVFNKNENRLAVAHSMIQQLSKQTLPTITSVDSMENKVAF